ncbi:MAG: hypothetical protein MJ237_06405 [bacterium]|nr:hypothetical protein [bacterium]
MKINQPSTFPTFKAQGIPSVGFQNTFNKCLRTFVVPKDDLAKIHTIADMCWEINDLFYKNKLLAPDTIEHFGENVFAKSDKLRTYSLNSILSNFKLLLRIPTLHTKQDNHELFTFIIGKKEENDEILRFYVKEDGAGQIITTPSKFDKEAPETIKKLKEDQNNATYLDTILNTVKNIYDYLSSIHYKKQTIHINPDKLKETISNFRTIENIMDQHSQSWGSMYKLLFLKQYPETKYNTKKKTYTYTNKDNENCSYYFNVLNGKNVKDFLRITIYDASHKTPKIFIIKPNGEIFNPKNRDGIYSMANDAYITLAKDEDIEKYDLINIYNSINAYMNKYKAFLEKQHEVTLGRPTKKHKIRAKNTVQNIKLDSFEAENIINNIGKIKTCFDTITYTQKQYIIDTFYKNLDITKHRKGIIYGMVPNTKNHYSCNIGNKITTGKLIINIYDDNDNILNSFVADKNGTFYIMKDVERRNFTDNYLALMSDEEIRTNQLEEICKDIKKTTDNYLDYINSIDKTNYKTMVQTIKSKTNSAETVHQEIIYSKPEETVHTSKKMANSTRDTILDKVPTPLLSKVNANKTKNKINNTELYRILTKIFDTQPSERNANIIPYVGSNNKIISAKFKFITSDGKTLQITKALTPWGINKFNYCIEVYDEGKTYYYRIDGEKNNKIIECDAQGHIILTSDRQLKHITQEEYCEKYPFMAKHFKQYAKEISKL